MTLTSYGLPVSGVPILCRVLYPTLKHRCLIATPPPPNDWFSPALLLPEASVPAPAALGLLSLYRGPPWGEGWAVSLELHTSGLLCLPKCSPSPGPPVPSRDPPRSLPHTPRSLPAGRALPVQEQLCFGAPGSEWVFVFRSVASWCCDILGATESSGPSWRALITPLPLLSWSPGDGTVTPNPNKEGVAREDLASRAAHSPHPAVRPEAPPFTPSISQLGDNRGDEVRAGAG